MTQIVVYLKKSTRPGKKYMVLIEGPRNKTIHFGAKGMSDYTKHKDKDRMKRYSARHKRGGETWSKSGIRTAGFWSKWLLWNEPTISGSKRDISKRFGITFKSGWSKKKPNKRKSVRKSRSRTKFGLKRKKTKKYERCVLSVKSKQSRQCSKKKYKGSGCYNPWAICNRLR